MMGGEQYIPDALLARRVLMGLSDNPRQFAEQPFTALLRQAAPEQRQQSRREIAYLTTPF